MKPIVFVTQACDYTFLLPSLLSSLKKQAFLCPHKIYFDPQKGPFSRFFFSFFFF